jgi:hypothetical protein
MTSIAPSGGWTAAGLHRLPHRHSDVLIRNSPSPHVAVPVTVVVRALRRTEPVPSSSTSPEIVRSRPTSPRRSPVIWKSPKSVPVKVPFGMLRSNNVSFG